MAEQELRESEARFRALVTVGSSVTYRMSPDWREMRRLDGVGFLVDMVEPTTGWVDAYIPADERLRVREAIDRAIGAKDTFELEHRVVRADGTPGWAFSRAIPLLDDTGEIAEWFGAISDVTARVKANQSFTRLFQGSPAPFLVLKPDSPRFTIAEVNDAYLAATMRARENLVGRGVFEAFPDNPDDATIAGVSTLRASLDRALATRQPNDLPNLKYDIARLDGTFEERWWSPINSPVLDDDGLVEAIIHNANDITEKLRAEGELRELNETLERRVVERTSERHMLARLVETTDALIQALDMDYRWIAINAACVSSYDQVYGKQPRVGDSLLDLLADMPEHQVAAKAIWSRALAGETFTHVDEFGDSAFDRRTYELRFETLRDGAGKQIGAFLTGRDVTDRIKEQARLALAEEALRQSQKMEAMGQLTGGVAHDFNNLLTPIVGSLDMLQRKGLGGEREQRLVAGAAQSAERAKLLVQRLLAFARRQPLQAISVDCAKLVTGMGDLVASTTGPQIKVVVEALDGLPPAMADPNQLEMALLNLSVNARDAMPDGGTLRISVCKEQIVGSHRSGLRPGSYVCLSVADTGSGMDEATLARAVEPFFSTKGIGKGTGLGLSMVHGLASQLGGRLPSKAVCVSARTSSFGCRRAPPRSKFPTLFRKCRLR